MGNSELPFGIARTILRLDGPGLYLGLHFVIIYVRGQDRSQQSYRDQLGFRVVVDYTFPNGNRWIEVASPDGMAQFSLAFPRKSAVPERSEQQPLLHNGRIRACTGTSAPGASNLPDLRKRRDGSWRVFCS
jgi:catechol 2,3-dioxygenase-like lactoylglutathione lyase family enzyme